MELSSNHIFSHAPDRVVTCQEEKALPSLFFIEGFCCKVVPGYDQEHDLWATFDQPDIRGLVTTKTFVRRGAASV